MVRLSVTISSFGQRPNDGRVYSHPETEQQFSHSTDIQLQQQQQQQPEQSQVLQPATMNASVLSNVECYSQPTTSRPNFSATQAVHEVLPSSSHSHLAVLSNGDQASQLPSPGWSHRVVRQISESYHRTQKRPYRATDQSSHGTPTESKYPREVKWCPVCRSPVLAGAVHRCTHVEEESPTTAMRGTCDSTSLQVTVPAQESHVPANRPSVLSSNTGIDPLHLDIPEPNDNVHFNSRIPNLLPIPQTLHPQSSSSPETTRQGVVVANPSLLKPAAQHQVPVAAAHPSLESPTQHDDDQVSFLSQKSSSVRRTSQGGPSWSGSDNSSNVTLLGHSSNTWETPTSLISRLTAGLTARSNQPQQDEKAASHRSCPSPSVSESSDASSFFFNRDPVQAEDPFLMAHQELMDEALKLDPHSATSQAHRKVEPEKYVQSDTGRKRGQSYTHSESASSEPVHSDSSMCGSQDSDRDDNSSSRYLDGSGQLPDIDTLLKSIKQPHLSHHVPDKSNINDFLEPGEIGHINHLIKSLSDAVLTISLPDSLYKNKGFTPLDYMDIHLNAVIRQFFFVFKNEDFLNLLLQDQIALLNGCSLRAVCCAGLYLFNKDSGCWNVPGSTSRINHPVVHISDLLQVYPQYFVTRIFELNTAAAKLGFDWPMGVIANCILMYTPLKKFIQEMDKVDTLRNKYVHLLLKYISWKHGHQNAALIFPEILKILDAILLLVEDLSSLTLNLTDDEVMGVEERLSTLTLIQMAPFKFHSDKFKETVASWSNLDCVRLGDIQNRLCMALHFSMIDSLQPNTAEYWTTSSMFYASNLSRDNQLLNQQQKNLPRLLPSTDRRSQKKDRRNQVDCLDLKQPQQCGELKKVNSVLAEKDLVLLRRFLEDITGRESNLLIQNIKEKMDAKQIQMIITKLCS